MNYPVLFVKSIIGFFYSVYSFLVYIFQLLGFLRVPKKSLKGQLALVSDYNEKDSFFRYKITSLD